MAQLTKHGVELGDVEDIVNHTLAMDKKSNVRLILWERLDSEDKVYDRYLSIKIETSTPAKKSIMKMPFLISEIQLYSLHHLSSERVNQYTNRMMNNNDNRVQYQLHQHKG